MVRQTELWNQGFIPASMNKLLYWLYISSSDFHVFCSITCLQQLLNLSKYSEGFSMDFWKVARNCAYNSSLLEIGPYFFFSSIKHSSAVADFPALRASFKAGGDKLSINFLFLPWEDNSGSSSSCCICSFQVSKSTHTPRLWWTSWETLQVVGCMMVGGNILCRFYHMLYYHFMYPLWNSKCENKMCLNVWGGQCILSQRLLNWKICKCSITCLVNINCTTLWNHSCY